MKAKYAVEINILLFWRKNKSSLVKVNESILQKNYTQN